MDLEVDKLFFFFTVFLLRELFGVKPGCTPAVKQDELYNQEIKTTPQSTGTNQADYTDTSLASCHGTALLHVRFGAGSEI